MYATSYRCEEICCVVVSYLRLCSIRTIDALIVYAFLRVGLGLPCTVPLQAQPLSICLWFTVQLAVALAQEFFLWPLYSSLLQVVLPLDLLLHGPYRLV